MAAILVSPVIPVLLYVLCLWPGVPVVIIPALVIAYFVELVCVMFVIELVNRTARSFVTVSGVGFLILMVASAIFQTFAMTSGSFSWNGVALVRDGMITLRGLSEVMSGSFVLGLVGGSTAAIFWIMNCLLFKLESKK